MTAPSIKNDLLRYAVVVTGGDGYRAIISLAEIDPAFGHQTDPGCRFSRIERPAQKSAGPSRRNFCFG